MMASMGIYGVMSFTVSQRRHEIGIRMALGANDVDVVRMIAAQGARPILAGVVSGLIGALLVARLLSSVVNEVSTTDPATFATVVVVLGLVAFLANAVPARRATRIDPIATLKAE